MSSVSEANNPPALETQTSWVEESMDRYSNPLAYARAGAVLPEPVVQEEKILASPSGGQSVKLVVRMEKTHYQYTLLLNLRLMTANCE